MKKLTVIPIMILVAILAMWMLNKDYSEIALLIRWIIAIGAALLSGGIAYLMFTLEERDKKVRGK
ncbi:histidine kinase [Neobacillus sp. D3-1R]|uniref:histidine kinase n=1 Tax=Neobacillus sp. D3-1R TaxID=3445778 RepID=UPI003F9FF6B5